MVSFLLRPNAARFPLFAASYKHYKQWVSIGADPSDLDSIDPNDRLVPYRLRLPSIRLAFFNHGLPWEGYMPCSPIAGIDPLQLLLHAPERGEVTYVEGGKHRIARSWIIAFCEIADKIEAACREIQEHAGNLFKRGKEDENPDYRPISVGPQRLEINFNSLEEAEARVELARASALCNTAFLAWFTSTVHSWYLGLSDDVAAFVRSLRLEEREMRGYVFNLALDFTWINLHLLIDHGVPIHYLWSPLLYFDLRFMRVNPWLIARVLEMKKQLGREPSDDEVLRGQGAAKAVLEYDKWFQPREAELDLSPPRRSPDTEHYVQYFYGWHPHPLHDCRLIERAKEAYEAGDPLTMSDGYQYMRDVNVIYRWVKKGASWVEDDDLEDWAVFNVPETYRQGDFMHGRELRRMMCAALPIEMYDEPMIQGGDEEVMNAEYRGLSNSVGEPHDDETWTAWWNMSEDEMPHLDYNSQEGCDRPPDVPIAPCRQFLRYKSDGGDDEVPSLLKRMGPPPSPPKVKSLAERLGPAVAASLEAGPSTSAKPRRAESTSRERGRARGKAPAREPSRAAERSTERRSTSPPSARATSSNSSSAAASASSRDYAVSLPDPSFRWSLVLRTAPNWDKLLERHLREVKTLDGVLTTPIRPRSADAGGRIRWAHRVLTEGYIVLLQAQHQVRMYVWRILAKYRTVEDFLEQFADTGAPLAIALPQSLYPSTDQDGPLEDEETHSVTFPAYGVGGKDAFSRWKDSVRSLARKPYGGTLYFASDIASFVLRRYAWDIVSSKVGEGPCEETRLHRSGDKFFSGGGIPSLFCDSASSEELALMHGCMMVLSNGDKVSYRHAFPPNHVWVANWPSKGEWGVEEHKYMVELAEAFEQGTSEMPSESVWRDRVRSRGRSRKGSGLRKSDTLQAADASAWAAHLERIYGGDRRFTHIADLGVRLSPARLYD